MEAERWHGPLRVVSYAILALMALAGAYAGYMSIALWTGIGV